MFEESFNLVIILSTRKQRLGLITLILITGISCGLVIQSTATSSGGAAFVLLVRLGLDTTTVYHAEEFTLSLSIENVYGFEDIPEISLRFKIPTEVEILSTSVPELDIENITDELYHEFGLLPIDEMIRFRIVFNVTSTEVKAISIQSVNVTYRLMNGITGFIAQNSEDIRLSGKKVTTKTEPLLPIPIGLIDEIDFVFAKIPAAPFFSIIGYIFPLLFYSLSIIVLRRIRYVRT
ncbi:MAG: hypothetical protein JSW11_22550 [Candidatus Heimdallarchaeota archaeon]|nr:MAG: hypothetical protein JSW11_22550 [Candidatus Heimdallarchaeota archaeon]